jgi:hypothetical protein
MDGKLPPPNPNLPYWEDCWSEGEKVALVDAWGSRYLDLNRGSLRQPQWREVADAVNSRPGASARRCLPRTDIQCKNRVDTLKKKYKVECTQRAIVMELLQPVRPPRRAHAHRHQEVVPTARHAACVPEGETTEGDLGVTHAGGVGAIGWTVRVAAIGRTVQINRRQNKARQAPRAGPWGGAGGPAALGPRSYGAPKYILSISICCVL